MCGFMFAFFVIKKGVAKNIQAYKLSLFFIENCSILCNKINFHIDLRDYKRQLYMMHDIYI